MNSGVWRWIESLSRSQLGMVIYIVSYTTIICEVRSPEGGTNPPYPGDRVSKLRAAERLSELGGYRAARLVQRSLQANRLGGRKNGSLSAVALRAAALDISFLFQAIERPSRSGTRDGKLLREPALKHAGPVQHGAKHEGLRRRQVKGFENLCPFPFKTTCESRSIKVEAIVEHGNAL